MENKILTSLFCDPSIQLSHANPQRKMPIRVHGHLESDVYM